MNTEGKRWCALHYIEFTDRCHICHMETVAGIRHVNIPVSRTTLCLDHNRVYEDYCSECREEGKGVEPASQIGITPAKKNDSGKPDMTLITYPMLEPAAKVLEFGSKKYARWNFRNPNPGFEQRLVAAILRHMLQHTNGEELDAESGLPHLAHALASLMMIFDRRANKKDGEIL